MSVHDTAMRIAKQAETVSTYVYVDRLGTVMYSRVEQSEVMFKLVGKYGPGATAAEILDDIKAAREA